MGPFGQEVNLTAISLNVSTSGEGVTFSLIPSFKKSIRGSTILAYGCFKGRPPQCHSHYDDFVFPRAGRKTSKEPPPPTWGGRLVERIRSTSRVGGLIGDTPAASGIEVLPPAEML
jgi:hypothetical protein